HQAEAGQRAAGGKSLDEAAPPRQHGVGARPAVAEAHAGLVPVGSRDRSRASDPHRTTSKPKGSNTYAPRHHDREATAGADDDLVQLRSLCPPQPCRSSACDPATGTVHEAVAMLASSSSVEAVRMARPDAATQAWTR